MSCLAAQVSTDEEKNNEDSHTEESLTSNAGNMETEIIGML